MHTLTPKLLLLFLFIFVAPPSNQAPKSPLAVSVVPTKNFGERGVIAMASKGADAFYLVLTNVSNEPQPVWEYWNSWGYQTISFELTTNDVKFVISRKPEIFTRNFPSTFLIQPGEHQVYAIRLDKSWEARPSLPWADELAITLKAIYQVSPTREAAELKVWTGRIESKTYNFTLRQW